MNSSNGLKAYDREKVKVGDVQYVNVEDYLKEFGGLSR